MPSLHLTEKADAYLQMLCTKIPTRQVGSPGNRRATRFFQLVMDDLGFDTLTQPFNCLDMRQGDIQLSAGGRSFSARISPYSLGCDVSGKLVAASTLAELEDLQAHGCILLLRGELAREQLMPKNFVFYNPEHHQRIYRILESKQPAAIIAATGRNPQLAGALYPFPLFEDGDFDIPSAYITDVEGVTLAKLAGQQAMLRVQERGCPGKDRRLRAH